MAFTYLILNCVFIAACLGALVKYIRRPSKAWWLTLLALIILTLVFDNLIIWAGIVAYDTSKLIGIYAGIAPIEDFFYAVLAVAIVPALWRFFGTTQSEANKRSRDA